MPGFPRPPSYTLTVSETELGPFRKYILEKPDHKKKKAKKLRASEMAGRRESDKGEEPWGLLAWRVLEVFAAETVGTAMLLFFGCMGLVTWLPGEALHPLQGAIVFAVVVATIIQIFGHISAAHLNPAVTIAFMMLGQITPGMAVVYIISECFGAVVGYGLLILLTPGDILDQTSDAPGLCCTVPHPGLTDVQAVAMEFFATCFLVMVVCACSDPRNADKSDSVPLKFGCTILALSIAVGPYTGASMNPARSMAPALWNGNWTSHWVYWLGTCLGGFFTAIFYQALFNRHTSEESNTLEEVPLNQVKVSSQRTKKDSDQSGR